MPRSQFSLTLAVSAARLWEFHCLSDAVQRLTPANEGLKVLRHSHPLEEGGETLISMPFLPGARIAWLARICEFEPPWRFVDEQVEGPMAFWRHEHLIVSQGPQRCELFDTIDWRLRWWQLPPLSHLLVRRKLQRLFAHRHEVIRQWCEENPG